MLLGLAQKLFVLPMYCENVLYQFFHDVSHFKPALTAIVKMRLSANDKHDI